jgi:hypothetical protein
VPSRSAPGRPAGPRRSPRTGGRPSAASEVASRPETAPQGVGLLPFLTSYLTRPTDGESDRLVGNVNLAVGRCNAIAPCASKLAVGRLNQILAERPIDAAAVVVDPGFTT